MLLDVIENNGLIVVNGTDRCSGVITRYRKTSVRTEESVLDFFIVCEKFFTFITRMVIDEARQFPLTKFSTKTGQKSIKLSDHNTLILDLNIRWNSNDKMEKRQEIFNFKNSDQFNQFEMLTESNDELRHCFDNCIDLNMSANKWLKILNTVIRKSFKKIRIKQQRMNPELENLFSMKESIRGKISEMESNENADFDEIFGLEDEFEDTVEKIASICAKKNKDLVNEYLGRTKDTFEGFNQTKVWSLKKKLAPKNSVDPPSAMKDKDGNLVTNKSELEELYLNTYVQRLKPNPVKEGLDEIVKLKEMLFNMRMENSKYEVTKDWTMDDLAKVLKSLKDNKARDAHGHVYELFKNGGEDLKYSLLQLFNLMKKMQVYPDIFTPSNISSFWKQKGSKDDMNNQRGVFNVVKIRTIFDKLILVYKYDVINSSMSCSNIGARKGRNIRDHLFVINGILNEALQNKNKNIDVQIVDIEKCFDKMNYTETANDMYEAGCSG